MGLSEPTLSFTIPSIYDNTILDCRVYHPTGPTDSPDVEHSALRRRGAIIAHPYAPLGGCFDDPVVGLVAAQVLREGFIVCTFNFRGAFGSKGRTSWTGKAEREDYVSVAGFFIHYLHQYGSSAYEDTVETLRSRIQVIFGGYSYGSFITTHLPDPSEIMNHLRAPSEGTAAAEIKIRAEHLASQMNEELQAPQTPSESGRSAHGKPKPRHHSHTLSVGGEETSPKRSRHSTDGRRSFDIRQSLDLPRKISSLRRKNNEVSSQYSASDVADSQQPNVLQSYLLISPLLPPISSFTAIPLGFNALKGSHEEQYAKLSKHPSLAVFGNDDFFTSAKKLRKWAKDIGAQDGSRFQYVEIERAGHFWRDENAIKSLKIAVKEWIGGLSEKGSSPRVISPEGSVGNAVP